MHPRGSPIWGVMMGAVGLTFVTVAVFLGFLVTRDGQLEPTRPLVEPVLPMDLPVEDAAAAVAPPDAAPTSAGSSGDAGPLDDAGLAEGDAADTAAAQASASAPVAPLKKTTSPTKAKKPLRRRHR